MTSVSDQKTSDTIVSPGARGALPVLSTFNFSKTFGGAKALQNVSFDVMPGEVHGLLGKNGSGKSTLVKILAGFHAPDEGGGLEFNGERVSLPLKPGDYRRLGMAFVHQNLGLIPSLTVLENLRLVQLTSGKQSFINWSEEEAAARNALARFDLDIDPRQRVDMLTPVQRALLAIVRAFEEIETSRAITGKPGLLLLDEPTPFLPANGVNQLFSLVRSITASGSSVIFISHDIDEVLEITDEITVLRDGKKAGELKRADASHAKIVEMIVGRSIARNQTRRPTDVDRPVYGKFTNLAGTMLEPCDIEIGKGEILGLTGLIGSGYEEIPYLVFGARPARSGEITLSGEPSFPQTELSPKKAIDLGFALLPADRQSESGVDSLTITDNIFLPDIARFFKNGFMRNGAMAGEARELSNTFEVSPNDPNLKLSALSGGNAQKVLFARWMNRSPLLLLLDEPTQGVDVGTRQQIFFTLRNAAADGMSIICASSDAEQLADICDRVLVFSKGQITREIAGEELTTGGISKACYESIPSINDPDISLPIHAVS